MEIIDIIERNADFLVGVEDPVVVAGQWEQAGFSAADVLAWTQAARCWDAGAAADLRDHGVTAEQASMAIRYGGLTDTLGYWAANGDLGSMQWSMQDVADYLRVSASTVRKYASEGRMPEPSGRVANSPWWRPERIIAWNAARPGKGGRPVRS